ncbi:MAG TPA: response regulator [Opitutaceae bacterium]|nr:response regulator [Opitutaceae bacterium]
MTGSFFERGPKRSDMLTITNTILLIEDNADDAAALRRTLKAAGIGNDVQLVTDGREAIAYLRGESRFGDRTKYPLPFLVFLDLTLPRLSGFEVLTWLRARPELQGIAVVVTTGSQAVLDQQRAYALGARSYQIKPLRPEDLHQLMRSMQLWWSRLGETDPIVPSSGCA